MKGRKDQKYHPYSNLLYIPPSNSSQDNNETPRKSSLSSTSQSVNDSLLEEPYVQQTYHMANNTGIKTENPQHAIMQRMNSSHQQVMPTTTQQNNNPFFLNLSKSSIDDILGSLDQHFGKQPQQPNNFAFHQSNLMNDVVLSQRLNMNAYKKRTVELYDEVISMGYPLLSKKTLELAFFSEDSMQGNYSNDVLSLLYAIHAVTCQAFGVHEEAAAAFHKSRSLLSESFDNSSNVFIAGTYCFFARYCSGVGDKGKAKFYLTYVDLFFKRKSYNFKSRRHINYSIEEETQNNENYSIFYGLTVDELHLMKYRVLCAISVDKSGEFFLNDCANFPGFTFGSYVSKIVSDGCLYAIGKIPDTIMSIMSQQVCQENLSLYLMLLEFSANSLKMHENDRKMSDTTRNIMNCLYNLYYHGCKLQILKDAGVVGIPLENEAHSFSISTLTGPLHLVQPLVLGAMIETAVIHMNIIIQIEKGLRDPVMDGKNLSYHYQMLELDLRALEIVRTKNKDLMDKLCKPLMTQLSVMLKNYNSQCTQQPLPTSIPSFIEHNNYDKSSQILADHLVSTFSHMRNSPPNQTEEKFSDAINVLLDELNK